METDRKSECERNDGMADRPILDKNLDSKTFRRLYFLKSELMDFCRENGLPASGGKLEITDRIAYYLETGRVQSAAAARKKAAPVTHIDENAAVEPDFVCSETHRAFFREQIGDGFSFNVAFQKWLKSNTGKTYKDAVGAYYQIMEDKKKGKTVIDKQFEYNTYIRDFFEDNKGKSLDEAIRCWKYKKQLMGHNRYERSDLRGAMSAEE